MNQKKLAKTLEVLDAINAEYVSPEQLAEFVGVVAQVMKEVKDHADENTEKIKAFAEEIKAFSEQSDSFSKEEMRQLSASLSALKKELTNAIQLAKAEVVAQMPEVPPPQDLSGIESEIRALKGRPIVQPDQPKEVRDKLETLKGDDRLDVSAIKGIDEINPKMMEAVMARAISIVDQRTSFLISKVSNLQAQVDAGGGGTPTPVPSAPLLRQLVSGAINGSNKSFTVGTSVSSSSFIALNGNIQVDGGVDYTISGTSITYNNAPPNSGGGDTHYLYST